MRQLIRRFSNYLGKINNYNEEQIRVIDYTLRSLCFELLKVVGILLIAAVMHCFLEALIAIAVMVSTKPFIGGYHEDTQLKCFVSSLVVVACIVILGKTSNLNYQSILILNAISFFAIWHQAPIQDPNMPMKNLEFIAKNRRKGLIAILFWIVINLSIFIIDRHLSSIGTWTVLFQAMLMFEKRTTK